MIAAVDLREDIRPGDVLRQPLGNEEVVNPPPGVVLPGVEAVAPPAVCPGAVWVQAAEGVHKPGGKKLRHLLALLVGKAGIAPVGARVLQVDLLVGHVQVPAENHRLDGVQLCQIGAEIVLPLHPVVDALEAVLGVGGVAAHQIEIGVLGGNDPSLMAVEVVAKAVGYGEGLLPGENGGTGIAFFVSVVPVHMVARQVQLYLACLELGLLQAVDVGSRLPAEIKKALLQTGPQAVDIPGNQFHKRLLC